MNIPLPKIDGRTEAQQLSQIKSYLYQLAQQLNWALSTLESQEGASQPSEGVTEEEYYEIKSMLAQSGTITELRSRIEALEQGR